MNELNLFRQMWRAELPTRIIPDKHPHDIIILENNSGTDFCFNRKKCSTLMRDIQKEHMTELGESDIQYKYVDLIKLISISTRY